jgi:hypothetical protein
MTTSEAFDKSFMHFEENRDAIVQAYKGKIIAIYLNKILGVYQSKMDAFKKVPQDHDIPNGAFLIKDCSENAEKHVRVYNASISF